MVLFLERESKKVYSLGGEKVNDQYSYTERPLVSSGIEVCSAPGAGSSHQATAFLRLMMETVTQVFSHKTKNKVCLLHRCVSCRRETSASDAEWRSSGMYELWQVLWALVCPPAKTDLRVGQSQQSLFTQDHRISWVGKDPQKPSSPAPGLHKDHPQEPHPEPESMVQIPPLGKIRQSYSFNISWVSCRHSSLHAWVTQQRDGSTGAGPVIRRQNGIVLKWRKVNID